MIGKTIFGRYRLDKNQQNVVRMLLEHLMARGGVKVREPVKQPDIEGFLLRKYRLKDIKRKGLFMLLNTAFILIGVVSLVLFLYGKVNTVTLVGTPVTLVLGAVIFRMARKYGVRMEDKEKESAEVQS